MYGHRLLCYDIDFCHNNINLFLIKISCKNKIYIKYQCQLFKYWYKITPRVYLIGANFFHADEE